MLRPRRTLRQPDPEALRPVLRALDALAGWHRLTVSGLDRVPRGPAVLVANHSGGAAPVDGLFLTRWYRERPDEPVVVLAHDAFFQRPWLADRLERLGVVAASRENALDALARGHKVLVFPGTDHDALRPWSARREVRLAGNRGFARLAVEAGVPVVPVVDCGGHEAFVVLTQGKGLARRLGLDRRLRWHSLPVVACLPWGLAVGPLAYVPYLPLPARIDVALGAPIVDDDVERLYARTEAALQGMLADAYGRRRWPVWG